jgi:hypothetical protein
MEIDKNRRKILALHDMTDDFESRLSSFVSEELTILRGHIGELQKTIDSFQDMEDKVTLAILNREGNVKTDRELCIKEIVKK